MSIDPEWLAGSKDQLLITGAAGFIGKQVVRRLVELGFQKIRCLVRPSGDCSRALALTREVSDVAALEIVQGNLLSRQDCERIVNGVHVIYHLAAGRGEKSFADAFLNSVVTTRNLLDACFSSCALQRFVGVSSFTVYTNRGERIYPFDEDAPSENAPELRGEAYCFAKVRQDEVIAEYGRKHGLPYVLIRPGLVYGPGNEEISGRIGIGTFGLFLHLGASNQLPLIYVDNCADAIVLGGLKRGIDGEIFNAVDNDLLSSREFLKQYKKSVYPFRSLYLPKFFSYLLCWAWERYALTSQGQIPPTFNRRKWYAYWGGSVYSNRKLVERLGWVQRISTKEGLRRHFESCRAKLVNYA